MSPHPEIIPIAYVHDSRSEFVGRHPHGQFFGDVVADPDWFTSQTKHTVTVVLHLFDADGHHTGSEFMPGIADRAVAREALEGLIGALGPCTRENIAVRLFTLKAHGRVWGLMECEANRDWVDLEPEDLAFSAPWDGSYSS